VFGGRDSVAMTTLPPRRRYTRGNERGFRQECHRTDCVLTMTTPASSQVHARRATRGGFRQRGAAVCRLCDDDDPATSSQVQEGRTTSGPSCRSTPRFSRRAPVDDNPAASSEVYKSRHCRREPARSTLEPAHARLLLRAPACTPLTCPLRKARTSR